MPKSVITVLLSLFTLVQPQCDSADAPQAPSFEIFVSSRGTHAVKRYSGTDGAYIDDFIKPGLGGLSVTQEIMFGPDGNLYVSGRGNDAILKYDGSTGAFIGKFTSGYSLDEPTKMTFGPEGLLYVSQWGKTKNKVARFNSTSGAFVDEITEGLNQGMAHTWDQAGNLYIVSYGSKDVKKYSPEGEFIEVFSKGGGLAGPVNLWFSDDGSLHVVDWETGSVKLYDSSGNFVRNFISGLARVEGFAFDREGNIYLCDWVNNVINKYDPAGSFISTFAKGGGVSQPNSIAIRYPD